MLFVFSEDFEEFFKMLDGASSFIRANPVPDDVRRRREKFWARQNATEGPVPRGKQVASRA
jgi:hypothetical protein